MKINATIKAVNVGYSLITIKLHITLNKKKIKLLHVMLCAQYFQMQTSVRT